MASENSENPVRNILVLLPNPISENEFGRFVKVFFNLNNLNDYLCAHIKDADNFYLHVSDVYLEELTEKCVHKIKQVRRIYVYYATNDTLQSGRIRFPFGIEESEKLEFYHERDLSKELENAEAGGALDPSRAVDRTTIGDIATLKIERLHAKQRKNSDCQSPEPKRFASTVQRGIFIQDIESGFICPSCKTIFQEPYQLECSHRLCRSCLNVQTRCEICLELVVKDKAWFDRGFNNEKQHLLTNCLECEWAGPLSSYQEHLNQNDHAFSDYSISRKQVAQSNLHEQILATLALVRQVNNSNVHTDQIEGAISILRNSIKVLNDDIQRLNEELGGYQHSISVLVQQCSSFITLVEELDNCISGMKVNQNLLYEEYLSLKERVTDAQAASFNGTLTWKITNFREKRMDARSQRQRSIYSPPFYSSPSGYKMCLRLFLNGDKNTRANHMSLYLVIMRGNYDAILHWPFKFQVTFTLLNQLQSNNNHLKSFRCDTTSRSFQRPSLGMNIPYGFSQFFPLDVFEQNEKYYVQDDTMFMKVENDFSAITTEISLNDYGNELLSDELHIDTINDNLSATICNSDTHE